MAVELSRGYRDDHRRWPFGAVIVVGRKIVGTGVNRVVELSDRASGRGTVRVQCLRSV
jgi:tRNA(Arg) A34 adenosine deaminase TadA